MNAPKSLKREIIIRLWIPVLLFTVFETSLSYLIGLRHTNTIYDKWLLDSALALTQEVKWREARIQVELPPAALEIFRWDQVDKTYFKISTQAGVFLAGDVSLTDPRSKNADHQHAWFFDDVYANESVRVVALTLSKPDLPEPIDILVAETVNKRQQMMLDLLLADLLPQLILVIIVGVYLYRSISSGLKPLHQLAQEIRKRSPEDLSPLADSHVYSEVKILTQTINRLLARLNDAIASQQRFVANAAHQLRTPIAGLKLHAERAQRETDLTAMRPAINQIMSSADRSAHIINQLLTLAKSRSLDLALKTEWLNALDWVRETCLDFAPKALQKNVEVSFDHDSAHYPMRGDPFLLREMLSNVLDNALKYAATGKKIAVRLKQTETDILLSIADAGPGIPKTEHGKIFERFYRLSPANQTGSGLGLAIVKEIIDSHGGQIELSESCWQGLEVTLTFVKAQS
ncbi:MAG: sensor histidine kinase N-terminal domain-containing protein [Methylococcales bacterium]|nr:sensor histidine kinase N-terminal domain-containing protein [Methylococcales bacterium]